MKILTWSNAIAAIVLFAAICVTALAKPESVTFFDHYFQVNVYRRPHWNMVLVDYIAALLALSGIVSIIGLIVNSQRLKRKGDYVRATLVICLMMSIAGLGLYFFYA
ncbi:hypothetical protein [Malonomonas rubra]|nr:hypothetical protein [Malonomonas rubra]